MSEPTEANEPGESTGGSTAERHVRVVLVDDHRMFRTGVQAEIGRTEQTGVEVVGEAADVDQAVTVITATRPEVVLLDVHLPGGGGVEVLRRCAPLMADPEQPVRFLALGTLRQSGRTGREDDDLSGPSGLARRRRRLALAEPRHRRQVG